MYVVQEGARHDIFLRSPAHLSKVQRNGVERELLKTPSRRWLTMDFLKAEIERKKKAISNATDSTSSGTKWFKQSDRKQLETKELMEKQAQLGILTYHLPFHLISIRLTALSCPLCINFEHPHIYIHTQMKLV